MNSLTLPDMAAQSLDQQQPLDWVGMADIALPLRLHGQSIAAPVPDAAGAGADRAEPGIAGARCLSAS